MFFAENVFIRVLVSVFLLAGSHTLQAETPWSVIKTLSINHVGDPRNNDGFHAEAFGIGYALNDSHALKLGFFENSQKRDSVLVGYSYTYRDTPDYDLTANLYFADSYDDTYFKLIDSVEMIPLLGLNWHLTNKVDLILEGIPVPGSDPYFLLQTGLSYRF
jgi:hypothetical protein